MANDPKNNPTDEEMPRFMQRQYGKSASGLEPSREKMSDVRKNMIRFALDLPIRDIRSYSGYRGDLLIEFTTGDDDILPVLKEHAESLGMEVVIKEHYDTRIHEVYCIVPDEDIYGVKI